jgi:hypothetical protein
MQVFRQQFTTYISKMDAKILGSLIMRYPGVGWRNEIIKQMKNTGITIPPQLTTELAKITPSILDIWWEEILFG